ncbi:hypothetical protein PUW41_02600 [Streptococcus anginosus]|nr:hypothetical protein PUW41_02600 [Streptococcus anginosus]
MLATLEAKKLIDDEHFSEVQQVYTSNLPQEVVDNVERYAYFDNRCQHVVRFDRQ